MTENNGKNKHIRTNRYINLVTCKHQFSMFHLEPNFTYKQASEYHIILHNFIKRFAYFF